jgi:hypothetical protein
MKERTRMENDVLSKVFENEIMANAKRNNLSPIEFATLIDDYLKIEIDKGTKLSAIEKKLGISKRVLYKYRSILKLPKETLDKFKGRLSFEQMSIVSYSIKDKSKIPEVLEQVAIDHTPSNELVYKVAEINDKTKIASHILSELQRIQVWVIGLKDRVKKMPTGEQKKVRESIEVLVGKLNGV